MLSCDSILRKRPVRESQTKPPATLKSDTSLSNAEKAAKTVGLNRPFSPMSRTKEGSPDDSNRATVSVSEAFDTKVDIVKQLSNGA
jgi:hypothetical protein